MGSNSRQLLCCLWTFNVFFLVTVCYFLHDDSKQIATTRTFSNYSYNGQTTINARSNRVRLAERRQANARNRVLLRERRQANASNRVQLTETWQANATHCGNIITPPRDLQEQQKWIEVIPDTVYAFSAYYDNIDISEPSVRVVGMNAYQENQPMKCRLWFSSEASTPMVLVVEAEFRNILQKMQKHHRLTSMVCVCRVPVPDIPYAVSLVRSDCENENNVFPVFSPINEIREFTVCVSPLHEQYGLISELVEFLEWNQILGANKFIIYNSSISYSVDKILQWYVDNDNVQVIRWPIPLDLDIHYFGQAAALNDCLYRNLYSSRFIVNADVDEYITPRKNEDWAELIKDIDPNSTACGYEFEHTRFGIEWNKTDMKYRGKHLAERYKSVTLLQLNRENFTLHYPHRSKYIVRPLRVELVGVHRVAKRRYGCKVSIVNNTKALLHHYRGQLGNDLVVPSRIADRTMLRYKDRLIQRLTNAWSRLKYIIK